MATNPNRLYPLSTPSGISIPLDVIDGSLGIIKQAFTNIVSGAIVIPTCDFVYVWCDSECYVRFGAIASAPADGVPQTDTYFIPPGVLMVLDHGQAANFTVIRDDVVANNGTLRMQLCRKYQDMRKSAQYEHN